MERENVHKNPVGRSIFTGRVKVLLKMIADEVKMSRAVARPVQFLSPSWHSL